LIWFGGIKTKIPNKWLNLRQTQILFFVYSYMYGLFPAIVRCQ